MVSIVSISTFGFWWNKKEFIIKVEGNKKAENVC
jgi:hypothetical protein